MKGQRRFVQAARMRLATPQKKPGTRPGAKESLLERFDAELISNAIRGAMRLNLACSAECGWRDVWMAIRTGY
jgi:hypothetical protein